jgi:hypothetical protein
MTSVPTGIPASRSAEVDAAMMRGNNGIVNKMEF